MIPGGGVGGSRRIPVFPVPPPPPAPLPPSTRGVAVPWRGARSALREGLLPAFNKSPLAPGLISPPPPHPVAPWRPLRTQPRGPRADRPPP